MRPILVHRELPAFLSDVSAYSAPVVCTMKLAARFAASALALSTGLAATRVSLEPVAEGLTSPLTLIPFIDGQKLIVDQVGYVRLLDKANQLASDPVLTWTNKLAKIALGSFDERGLIDLVPHPKFARNRRVFITYSAPLRAGAPADWDNTMRVSELTLPFGSPPRIDPNSEKVILEVDKPYNNHNSGRLAFGPDGYLYISVGDGGNAHDQGRRPDTGNGQNLQTHLGKLLRLDVDKPAAGKNYGIPKDNPFADGKAALPEIYAYGLRNIWGFSFDRGGQHELFAADVGQDLFEEVNIITKGGNYGWSLREGFEGFNAKSPQKSPADAPKVGARGEPLLDPILTYKHVVGGKNDPEALGTSITGGYVYRGKALKKLRGQYVFADWSRNWGIAQGVLIAAQKPANGSSPWSLERLELVAGENFPGTTFGGQNYPGYITGIGQDADGELFILTNGSNSLVNGKGRIWKLVPAK
jgi:glucose/arabinose dehydrogenase